MDREAGDLDAGGGVGLQGDIDCGLTGAERGGQSGHAVGQAGDAQRDRVLEAAQALGHDLELALAGARHGDGVARQPQPEIGRWGRDP